MSADAPTTFAPLVTATSLVGNGRKHWAVLCAPAGVPVPRILPLQPGEVCAVVMLADGETWPDQRGAALATAVLQQGGIVALGFASLADALACQRRLQGDAR